MPQKLFLGRETVPDSEEQTAIVTVSELRNQKAAVPDRHLIVRVKGAQVGHVTQLGREPIRVGRSRDSTLWLADEGVSRLHAQIIPTADGYAVEDAGSANGTFVQGQRVTRHVLSDGDVIQFGPTTTFRYAVTDPAQEALLQRLYEATISDPLTGARNREYFNTKLEDELLLAPRYRNELSLLMIDVDHFKQVNDRYGHEAGDAVLLAMSDCIRGELRINDLFARYGGEEFALLAPKTNSEIAYQLAERLRASIATNRVDIAKESISVTVSIGAAQLDECTQKTPNALVELADQRLYAAKHAGRNRVVGAAQQTSAHSKGFLGNPPRNC